jgi:L-amino acid N-acyltransferase YncA
MLKVTTYGNLNFLERIQVRRLTLNSTSALSAWLKRAKPEAPLILAKKGLLVQGWGTTGSAFSNLPVVHMLYIRPSARGKGLGKSILNKLAQTFGDAPAVMWDITSAQFYHKALQANYISSAILLQTCPDHMFLDKHNSELGIQWFIQNNKELRPEYSVST